MKKSMIDQITVLMIGIGGYGVAHLNALLRTERKERFRIVGAVDPYASASSYYEELKKREESHPGSVSPGLMREMRFYSIIYGIIVVIVVAVNLVFMMLVNTGSISNM